MLSLFVPARAVRRRRKRELPSASGARTRFKARRAPPSGVTPKPRRY